MSDTIVFVSNQRVKEGKLEAYTQLYQQVAEMTKATKPGTAAHLAYVNEKGTEMSIVHIFPNAESMERYMLGVDELARKAYEFMEIASIEIYGRPSDRVLEMMEKIVGSGVTLTLKPHNIGGYIRLEQKTEPTA